MRTTTRIIAVIAALLCIGQVVNAQHYYRGRGHYGGYYNYGRSYYAYAPRVRVNFFAHPYRVIPFGGLSYYYSDGFFYRPYGSRFSIIFPPIGIHVNILPYGYRTIYFGGVPYYYYNGIFFNHYDDYYEVVKAPIGAEVPELPSEAKVQVINDQKFYELNGTYYKQVIRDNGEVWYRVVGKHGVLNTDTDHEADVHQAPEQKAQPDVAPSTPSSEIGTVVSELPENSKVVVINNQKMFEAPDGTFYTEVIDNNKVNYKVVGK
jgi:hypothetical protein